MFTKYTSIKDKYLHNYVVLFILKMYILYSIKAGSCIDQVKINDC